MNQRIANHLESLALNSSTPHVQSSLQRAARNLRASTTDVSRIEDLKQIKGFGPFTIRSVERFLSSTPAMPVTAAGPAGWAMPHWLSCIGMTRFESKFAELGFDTFIAVKAIGDTELDLLGVTAPGHRLAFRTAVAALNNQPPPPPPSQPSQQRAPVSAPTSPTPPPPPTSSSTTAARKRPAAVAKTTSTGEAKRRPSQTAYAPRRLSGGWAILMVLHLHRVKAARPPNDMTPLPMPIDVCRTEAQLWATHSMIKDSTHNYTAWSSLSTLREKFLVTVSKKQVALTPTGIQTAATIFAEYSTQQVLEGKRATDPPFASLPVSDAAQPQSQSQQPLSSQSLSQPQSRASTSSRSWLDLSSVPIDDDDDVVDEFEPVSAAHVDSDVADVPELFARRGTMHSNEGEIVLIVDTRERTMHRGDEFSVHLRRQLDARRVVWESRTLAVGDFAWILRAPASNGAGVVEHMLHVLVERKSVNDLACSLTDGRYAEQRQRIERTGLAMQFYVIEGTEQDMVANNLPQARLLTVMADLAVLTNLKVHRTANLHETVHFLHQVTSRLIADLRAGRLESTERQFGSFQSEFTKQSSAVLSHLFVKQMYQVKGVTMQAAMALAQRFGTCASLVHFLSDKPREGRIAALAALQVENGSNSEQPRARTPLGSRSAACIDQMLFGGELDDNNSDDSEKSIDD
jgi:ERCC4-type nuclease